jgi:hypothetical protein
VINANVSVSLYYTGLTDTATITLADVNSTVQTVRLERDYTINVPMVIQPNSYAWWVIRSQ